MEEIENNDVTTGFYNISTPSCLVYYPDCTSEIDIANQEYATKEVCHVKHFLKTMSLLLGVIKNFHVYSIINNKKVFFVVFLVV